MPHPHAWGLVIWGTRLTARGDTWASKLYGAAMTADTRQFLERFVIDSSELELLEQHFDQPNFFEAIGQVASEAKHSNFLAYLLDPSQTHGFHDEFLRLFLKRALRNLSANETPLSPIEFDVWDLGETIVEREHANIDILLINRRFNFIIVIENKIHSSEHSQQLRRYRAFVVQHYRDFQKVFLFLTIEGDIASDHTYTTVTYADVLDALEHLTRQKKGSIGGDVFVLIDHYTRMIRRHLMEDPKLDALAREIYRKHKNALDFIFERLPDRQNELRELLEGLVDKVPMLQRDRCSKGFIRFAVREWDGLDGIKAGKGWTESSRILLFEFKNLKDRVGLNLIIGPGDKTVRERLFALAQKNRSLFSPSSKILPTNWLTIWAKQIIGSKEYDKLDLETATSKIERAWEKFLKEELPPLISAVQGG